MSICPSTRAERIGARGRLVKLGKTRVDVHIAQINIGRARGPVDGPMLAEFMALLDAVNALADSAAGFGWGMQHAEGNNTALRPYDDDRIIVNMSPWESLDSLWQFVYSARHLEVMRQRR